MAGEASDAHSVLATIQPAITLLGLGIAAALASRALRLNPIVGYLGLGLGLASLGIADRVSGPVVAAMAEAGVMFLLFNLGLHFSLGRIRAGRAISSVLAACRCWSQAGPSPHCSGRSACRRPSP